MIKNNKWTLAITSVVILLPMAVGVILWNDLPDTLVTHWGVGNDPNGFSGKPFTVVGIPLILLAFHWLCVLASEFDKKKKNQSKTLQKIVLWIIPVCSVLLGGTVYAYALGIAVNVDFWGMLFVGFLFIVIGNYLPKSKQSYTMGIKLPWTLADSENWNKTHRLAGFLWTGCGVVIVLGAFLRWAWLIIPVLVAAVVVPTVYSYIYYKKNS